MKKIIHLSDLHIGHKKQNLTKRFAAIVESIIFDREPAENYIIVVTGDLVETATEPSNHETAIMLLEKLSTHKFKLLVIPGNHDYGTGTFGDQKYMLRFKSMFYGDENYIFPKLDIIDNIAFIGLDSTAEELHLLDKFGANGELGKEQRTRLNELLSSQQVIKCNHRVIYLHHHPFDPYMLHELKDSNALGEILKKHGNIDAILFGHNHRFRNWNGKWEIKRCYDAGSTTRKNDVISFIRIIDLSQAPKDDYEADYFYDF